MTKEELLEAIAVKIERIPSIGKEIFIRGLKYKTKEELKDLLEAIEVKVDENGWDIKTL